MNNLPRFAWVRINRVGESWLAKAYNISYWKKEQMWSTKTVGSQREQDKLLATHGARADWKHYGRTTKGNEIETNMYYQFTPLKVAELLRLKQKGFIKE